MSLPCPSFTPWIDRKRIQVSSIESKENLVFENLANPSLYSHAHMGAYCQEKNILCSLHTTSLEMINPN